MRSILMAGALAVSSVAAQLTGEFGRRSQYGGTSFGHVVMWILFVGLTVLVWLWVIKLFKELTKKK